ncbi:hypothetical protein ACK1QP_004733 [Salmonella enterica]
MSREYRHDASGLLTGIDGGSRQYRYGYDGAGNRICVRCGGAPGV